MATATLNINPSEDPRINKYELYQSESEDVLKTYKGVFEKVEGSLTTVSDNDAVSRINVAMANLSPTYEQYEILNLLKDAFKYIEGEIDPERLKFDVTKALDEEICINRHSDYGLSKIIIHDDGLIAYSFISFKGISKPDALSFYEGEIDYEKLSFRFFA